MPTSTHMTEIETIKALDQYLKSDSGIERARIAKTLPQGLTTFAFCLGYNNAKKCVADFKAHHNVADLFKTFDGQNGIS